MLGFACGGDILETETASSTSILASDSQSLNLNIGTKVGERLPEFSMRLKDTSIITLGDFVAKDKPVLLYFFATWCPTCRAELQHMMQIYPEFASEVLFYVVGQDPTETLKELESIREERGYPWPVAEPVGDMLIDLWVLQESTKIAFDGDGVIVYRHRGGGDANAWPKVFRELHKTTLPP